MVPKFSAVATRLTDHSFILGQPVLLEGTCWGNLGHPPVVTARTHSHGHTLRAAPIPAELNRIQGTEGGSTEAGFVRRPPPPVPGAGVGAGQRVP